MTGFEESSIQSLREGQLSLKIYTPQSPNNPPIHEFIVKGNTLVTLKRLRAEVLHRRANVEESKSPGFMIYNFSQLSLDLEPMARLIVNSIISDFRLQRVAEHKMFQLLKGACIEYGGAVAFIFPDNFISRIWTRYIDSVLNPSLQITGAVKNPVRSFTDKEGAMAWMELEYKKQVNKSQNEA